MSCTDEAAAVEREITLPAPPGEVWGELPALLGDRVELVAEPGGRLHATGPDGDRIGVVEDADAPHRLSFWWTPADGDAPPSRVELELTAAEMAGHAVGTLLRVRETRFDAGSAFDGLLRGPLARARS